VEKERQTYIDAGFDGWILKPISINRLTDIITGIVDQEVRRANLYRSGGWEHGGWFDEAQKNVFAANTRPSEQPPMQPAVTSGPSKEVKAAAETDDPYVKEDDDSRQTQEQQRLGEQQATAASKASSLPNLRNRGVKFEEDNVTREYVVSSPQPVTPNFEER
jgi:hypothetical protein